MWLFLRRLKEEGKEGVKFGQYLYEIYNHDLELRVSKAGVSDHFFLVYQSLTFLFGLTSFHIFEFLYKFCCL